MALKDTFGGQMLAGMGGSLFNGLFNIGSAKRQYKYQSRLQQQQYDLNEQAAQSAFARQLQFYEQQRNDEYAYNDPSAVRERYEGAGLNPNAAFGVAGSYQPANAPSGSVNAQQGVGLGQASAFPMSDPVDMALKLAQIRNIDAQSKKTESETGDHGEFLRGQKLANDLKDAGLISQNLANQLDVLNLQFKTDVYDTEVQIRKQTADNMAKQYEQMNQQIAESVSKQNLNEQQIKQSASLILLNTAQAVLAKTQSYWHGKVAQSQINEAMARIENLTADSNLKSAQQVTELARLANLYAQKASYDASARRSNAEAEIQEFRNSLEIESRSSFVGELLYGVASALNDISPLKFSK